MRIDSPKILAALPELGVALRPGQALRSRRRDAVIHSKSGSPRDGGPGGVRGGGHPRYLRQTCEQSLKNLGIETLDVFCMSRVDPNVPVEESVGAMAELVKEGKSHQIPMPLEETLKGFNKGFGPKLDDLAKAYKAKNDADIKKHATKALEIAFAYDKSIVLNQTSENQMALKSAKSQLQPIIHKLTDLKNLGAKANNPF